MSWELTCGDSDGSIVVSGVLGLLAPGGLPSPGGSGLPRAWAEFTPRFRSSSLPGSLPSEMLQCASLSSPPCARLGSVPEAGGARRLAEPRTCRDTRALWHPRRPSSCGEQHPRCPPAPSCSAPAGIVPPAEPGGRVRLSLHRGTCWARCCPRG